MLKKVGLTVIIIVVFCGVVSAQQVDYNTLDEKGFNQLHHAIIKQRVVDVIALLKVGADPRVETSQGKTAFDLALEGYDSSVRSRNVERVEVYIPNNTYGQSDIAKLKSEIERLENRIKAIERVHQSDLEVQRSEMILTIILLYM